VQIRLTRFRRIVLTILLLPFVAVLRLVRTLRRREKPVYASSIDGAPLDYADDNPILIALWAIGRTSGMSLRAGLSSDSGRSLPDAVSSLTSTQRAARSETRTAQVVPTLILRHHGTEIGRFVNVLKDADVRSAIAAAVAKSNATPDTGR
jgi:hypothetical protein